MTALATAILGLVLYPRDNGVEAHPVRQHPHTNKAEHDAGMRHSNAVGPSPPDGEAVRR